MVLIGSCPFCQPLLFCPVSCFGLRHESCVTSCGIALGMESGDLCSSINPQRLLALPPVMTRPPADVGCDIPAGARAAALTRLPLLTQQPCDGAPSGSPGVTSHNPGRSPHPYTGHEGTEPTRSSASERHATVKPGGRSTDRSKWELQDHRGPHVLKDYQKGQMDSFHLPIPQPFAHTGSWSSTRRLCAARVQE